MPDDSVTVDDTPVEYPVRERGGPCGGGVQVNRPWIQLRDLRNARVLLILPCNAAACVGNYFRAEVYRKTGWNTWREADLLLQDLRKAGRVAFAAVDSSILETAQNDPRGAIVLETEMHRARNPEGEDWGSPSWRWFRPTRAGHWTQLEVLTEALVKGVRRIEELGFSHVLALVNPRAYFLALAAAGDRCRVLDRWVLFRTPAHPRFLLRALRELVLFVRAAAPEGHVHGGIYPIPDLYPILQREAKAYRDPLPAPWTEWNRLPSLREVKARWAALLADAEPTDEHDSSE